MMLLIGCVQTRVVYVPHGTPVRLRESVKKVKIWVFDANGFLIPAEIDLPEGWWVLPDQKKEEKKESI